MKDFISKPGNFTKVEFWAATTIFVFAVFFLITSPVRNDVSNIWTPNKAFFNDVGISFNYYQHYFFPQIIRYIFLYLTFLLLNFIIVPKLIRKEALAQNILLIILSYLIIGAVFGTTDTYLKNYLFNRYNSEQATYNVIFQNSFLYAIWLLLLFGFYSIIKYFGLYLLSNSEAIQNKYRFITPAGITAFVLWMISMFLLLIVNADPDIIAAWGLIVLSGIILYLYSFYSLIPKSLSKKNPFRAYILKIFLLLVIAVFPIVFLLIMLTIDEETAFGISFFNVPFQLLITAPLCWILFKRQMRGNEEIYVLKKELGQSNASFDFLRSQINPHFLFNALNTIYGTAIQEKAERTSEGIEKLGDMMRFMLQENMQEKISLAREIEYLNNYISLQKLRTDPNPTVKIQTQIEHQVNSIQISPMLLIPFVENAFKHGISFREPSHININLETKDHTLYFDVHNTKHVKFENDPEKNKSGIGLKNVKQRLQLLYPAKHELIIRETGKEFFVHLTIHLL